MPRGDDRPRDRTRGGEARVSTAVTSVSPDGLRVVSPRRPSRAGVVLHGYGGDGSEVTALAAALAERLNARVFVPDLPGQGSASTTRLSLAAVRAAVAAVAAKAGTSLDFAVGHSMGARLALDLDAAAFVLLAMPGEPVFGASTRELVRTLRPRRVNESEPLAGLMEVLSAPLAVPERPTLLLTPADEIPSGVALAEEWAARGVESRRVENTTHRDIVASPEAIDAAVRWLEARPV